MDTPLVTASGPASADGGPRSAVPAAALWMVLLTVFLDQFGNNVVVPMLAPYARADFHATDGQIGYLFSFPCASAVVFSSFLARITTSLGRKPVFIMSLIGMALANFCQGVAGSFGWLLLGRTFGGMWLNTMTTARVYINESTDWDVAGNERSYWFAQFSLAQNVAKLFAPALGGALSHYGLNVPSLVTSGVNLVGAALVYFYVVESPRFLAEGPSRPQPAKAVAGAPAPAVAASPAAASEVLRMRLFWLAGMLTTACMKLSQTVFAIFAIDKYGLGTIDIGFCFLLGALGTIVASRFVPSMNRSLGPYKSGIIMSCAQAVSMVLLPLFPVPADRSESEWAWRASLICMVGCFIVMSAAGTIALSFQSIISGELDNQPLVQTGAFQIRQGGQFVIPIVASRLFQVNLAYPWLLGSLLAASAAVPVYYMQLGRISPPRLERLSSGYGDEFQDEKLTEAEIRELGEFMRRLLVQKHLKWSKDREHVEKILERSIPEVPITDRESYYEALIQYAT